MFGGSIDMTPFGALVKSVDVIYWLLVLGALTLALWGPRRQRLKLLLSGIVLFVGVTPAAFYSYKKYEQKEQAQAQLDAAIAHFGMRCKNAGEKIYRIADRVDGIVLLKPRSKKTNTSDQYLLDDPYGRNCGGDDCISGYLIDHRMVPSKAGLVPSKKFVYRFIEVPENDGDLYARYRAYSINSPLERVSGQHRTARFAVSWEDVSTPEDRRLWIAGGRLTVIDLQLNEVIAERTGFLFDPGQGSEAGARTPWTWARAHDKACPTVQEHNLTFVEKVLKPIGS